MYIFILETLVKYKLYMNKMTPTRSRHSHKHTINIQLLYKIKLNKQDNNWTDDLKITLTLHGVYTINA